MKHGRNWLSLRLFLAAIACVFAGWLVDRQVLLRQLDVLGVQSQHRADFFRMSLESLLSRNASLPRVVAMEDRLKAVLRSPGNAAFHEKADDYLLGVREGADINAAFLLDKDGLTVAASNYLQPDSYVGNNYAFRPYFRDAMESGLGLFYGLGATTGNPGYFMTAPIKENGIPIGAATVKISLEDFESALVRSGEKVLLVDANGIVFLTSVPQWKYHSLMPLAAETLHRIEASRQYHGQQILPLGIGVPLQAQSQLIRMALPNEAARDYLVQSVGTGPLGWSIVLLAETRQERQNALLAGFAAALGTAFLLLAVIIFRLNVRRYQERRLAEAILRQAHHDLERRIAERTADLTATNISLEEKIDALKTTEKILGEARDSAVQAGKLAVLGQMAAGISHEINQPLTALHTFADNAVDLLERGCVEDVRENLGLIRQMAVRMGHIVGEIKSFTRKPSLEKQAVNVAGVVDQALMLVEARRRKIDAQIDVQGISAGLCAWADPQRLEQIVVNLLLNALDAVAESENRVVLVAACRDGKAVRISVRDSGSGLPEAVVPHLFEPFFTTKAAGQGLGLGLAISRMIAAELGGSLDARNHEMGGAEFSLILEAA